MARERIAGRARREKIDGIIADDLVDLILLILCVC